MIETGQNLKIGREACDFLKSNRVIATDDNITMILAQIREGTVQKKINQIKDYNDI